MHRILTLTTDFGQRDAYVAAMKAVILSLQPDARLVDISHEISPQDVMEAAFVMKNAVPFFPSGTVHLAVVDPGVGTSRLPVAASFADQFFVGPDNGLFSLLLDGRAPDQIVVLDRPSFWRTDSPSTTFHGRDLFAPVAAHLATGVPLVEVGSPLDALQTMHWALPVADEQGVRGWVVHVDRYGNCITNISESLFLAHRGDRTVKCYAGSAILSGTADTYASVEHGEPLVLFGSSGNLEIAVNGGNAAELLDIHRGAAVNIIFLATV